MSCEPNAALAAKAGACTVPTAKLAERQDFHWDTGPATNSFARLQLTATGNPPATTLLVRCVVNFSPIPFPNHPATAREDVFRPVGQLIPGKDGVLNTAQANLSGVAVI